MYEYNCNITAHICATEADVVYISYALPLGGASEGVLLLSFSFTCCLLAVRTAAY